MAACEDCHEEFQELGPDGLCNACREKLLRWLDRAEEQAFSDCMRSQGTRASSPPNSFRASAGPASSLKATEEEEYADALVKKYGIPFVHLHMFPVSDRALSLVPKEMAYAHRLIAIDRIGSVLSVGMVNPVDKDAINAIESLTGLRVKPLICTLSALRLALVRYYE